MKYILISLTAFILCFGGGFLLAGVLLKKSDKKSNRLIKTAFTFVFGLVILCLLVIGYMSIHYSADDQALAALKGNETVSVQKIRGGYFFDGPGSEQAIVFYQGAKVECEAYAPLMLLLAERGFDCFLADMPFNFAIFAGNQADLFTEKYTYDHWIMAGHSMGGLMASQYANAHTDVVDGIVLLASYSLDKFHEDFRLVSVYGTEDGCLNREEYEKDRGNWPPDSVETVISGGNHAQFAHYGPQKGDGSPAISAEEQIRITADTISAFFSD